MSNWRYVKIGDVCTVERGGSPRPIDKFITDDPNGINWIKIGDTNSSMYITQTAQKIIPEGMKKSRYVQPGDFLLSNSMSFGRPYILKIDGCIHDGWLVLRDNDGIFDKRFLYYYLSSPSTYQKFKNMAVGGVVNNLNSEMVRGVTVPVPPMDEQIDIVTTLDKVTELIALRKEQLGKLDQLVKSRFIELFGDLERTTTIARYISELRGGKSLAGTEPCKNKVLKTGAATFGWFDPEQYKYLPADYEPLPEHKVETGDVIISRMNTPELVGACSYVFDAPDDMYYPDRLWKAVLKENTNPIFLWQLLWDRDIRKAIKESSGGTSGTMHNISKTNLLAIKCMDAPIELQNEYAEFVKQTDKSKLAIQQSLDKLELLKKSLMQKYFG